MFKKYVHRFCWLFLFIPLTGVAQTIEKDEQRLADTSVFDSSEVLSFHITIHPEDWTKMQPKFSAQGGDSTLDEENTPRRSMFGFTFAYVKSTVIYGNEVYRDVGVRFKGNSSVALSLESLKKPYKLDFDRFVEGQTFHGFKKLNFSNSTLDPSFMREKLAYDLLRKAGVPAPEATFAKLYLSVDGKYENAYIGLYVMVEQVDKRFLQRAFGNSKGLLVERESLGDIAELGDAWESDKDAFSIKSKKNRSDPSRLIQFVKFLHQAPDEEFEAGIEQFLNVDSFLMWLAVNTLLTNLDSYAGMGHNYYLYLNEATRRFEFIPKDLNYAFGNFSLAGAPERRLNFDIYHPYTGKKILIERLLQIAKYQEQYLTYMGQLIDGPFHPDVMHAEIDQLYALIQADAVRDTHNAYPPETFEHSISANVVLGISGLTSAPIAQPQQPPLHLGFCGSFRQHTEVTMQVIGLKPFVTKRVESVRAQLSGQKQGYVIRSLVSPSRPSFTGFQRALATEPSYPEAQYVFQSTQAAYTTEVAPRSSNVAGRVVGEILMGGVAGAGFGILGGFMGAKIDEALFDDYYWQPLLGVLIGGYIGYTVGSSLGVYVIGNSGDETGSYPATLGGSILGSVVGSVIGLALVEKLEGWALIPILAGPVLGAVSGFNATRKQESPLESGEALLNFNEGKMYLAVPTVSLYLRRRGELIQRVNVVKVRF
ncbi:CotH kinase family protein [Candidatus Poribacteria bacterium]|nr:CotH kinase family protein [Candidatus Poribacteria bacterium]